MDVRRTGTRLVCRHEADEILALVMGGMAL